jgi:hypothetical protein
VVLDDTSFEVVADDAEAVVVEAVPGGLTAPAVTPGRA